MVKECFDASFFYYNLYSFYFLVQWQDASCQEQIKLQKNVKHPVVLAVAVILPPLPWNQTELANILDVFCSNKRFSC